MLLVLALCNVLSLLLPHALARATPRWQRSMTLNSSDNQDHSFCGIMFDIKVNDDAPLTMCYITSICVRGSLGPVSVYRTNEFDSSYNGKQLEPGEWTVVFSEHCRPSWKKYRELKLDPPVEMKRGETRGFYLHSTELGDQAIVYDNRRRLESSCQDDNITVQPGMAHLGVIPFSNISQFGWGTWRRGREFVGQINYGVKQVLWTKESHHMFPFTFRTGAASFYVLHALSFSGLPADIVGYVLNMCAWDWFDYEGMSRSRSKRGSGSCNIS